MPTSSQSNSSFQSTPPHNFVSNTNNDTQPCTDLNSRRWSSLEQRERRAKGLWFHCDEAYSSTHVCKKPVMAILDCPSSIEPPTEPPDSAKDVEDPSHEPPPIYPFHKITTTTIGEIMHFHGTINNLPINIFIDCGSVMNFLNPSIAYKLNLPISKPTSLQFSTASGQPISPSRLTSDVTVTIQGYEFTGSFLLLPVTGCDLLLGAQWLNTFGFIGWRFAEKVVMFTTNGKCHVLHGLTS